MRLVVSPHLDDAVMSCGSYLSESHEPVLTVFDGIPPGADMVSTDYDRSCGFVTAASAMQVRAQEDAMACETLGVKTRFGCDMLDLQYNPNRPTVRAIGQRIDDVLSTYGFEGIVAPLGVQHPDHVLTSEACLWLANRGVPTWLYEELPYRVVWPEAAHDRLEALRSHGWAFVPDFLGGGSTEQKERAVRCYDSQVVDVHCCLVPERYWAVMG